MTWSLYYSAFKRGILDRAAVAGRTTRNGSAVANRTAASSNAPNITGTTTPRSASTTTQKSKKKELKNKHNPYDRVEQWDFMVLDVSLLF
jgi:heme-binding NEAT domain protein